MKITLINHSDTRGGASVVTFRLMEALRALGHDARMVVMHRGTDSPYVAAVGEGIRARATFLAEHAEIFLRDGLNRDNVFKISTARYGLPLHRHPWVAGADALCLNWVNQGMLSLREVRRLCSMGKPVAWTMHDMWNMTGVCHHAGTCTHFQASCGHCPLLLGGRCGHDLSQAVHARKARLYACTDIRFVAVSRWLARKAQQSTLLRDASVTVIPNAFPVEDFPVEPQLSRRQLELPEGPLVVMGAARLDDSVKNFPLAVETLNRAWQQEPFTAVFFGTIRDSALLERLRVPYVFMGTVTERRRLASLYAHADVVLSTSRYETLPGTLIEGISAGAMAVATSNGGQDDIITDDTGFMASADDAGQLSALLVKALRAPADRRLRHMAMERFAAAAVARRYVELLSAPHGT